MPEALEALMMEAFPKGRVGTFVGRDWCRGMMVNIGKQNNPVRHLMTYVVSKDEKHSHVPCLVVGKMIFLFESWAKC